MIWWESVQISGYVTSRSLSLCRIWFARDSPRQVCVVCGAVPQKAAAYKGESEGEGENECEAGTRRQRSKFWSGRNTSGGKDRVSTATPPHNHDIRSDIQYHFESSRVGMHRTWGTPRDIGSTRHEALAVCRVMS